jgi:hypothetical protein
LVVYLRFTQGISFERLAKLLSDILGLEISEGALVNMLEAARHAFATQTPLSAARLLCATAMESERTSRNQAGQEACNAVMKKFHGLMLGGFGKRSVCHAASAYGNFAVALEESTMMEQ